MSLGWRESYSSASSPPEESEDLGHHSIDSLDDCTDIKPTVKENTWILPDLWHHMLDYEKVAVEIQKVGRKRGVV